jgi:CDP-glycerol glycerophosphotransferase
MIDSLLTIVVIVYNTEKYLYDCMDSVVNQTYKNLEIICIDDCSTDRSSKILESYALQDSRIKIITNSKNSGPGITRNAGMDAAQGEYILFIDSDDWIDLTTCEKLITKAMENDAEIVFYPAWQVDGEQRKKIPNHCEVGEPLTLKDRKLLLRETLPSPWSKLWKRSFMMQREIRFPAARRSQDHKPHWMGCVFAEKTGFLDEPLYFYRSNPGQVTRCSDERLLGCIMAQQETEEFLIKENKFNEFKDEFCGRKNKK